MRRFMIAIATCLPLLPLVAQGHTTGSFHGCNATGDAGPDHPRADPTLNALKNRDVAPAEYLSRTVSAIINDVPERAMAAGKKKRTEWTAAQRNSIAAREDTGIVVVGYLAGVKKEEEESCNCHEADRVDYHMWLVSNPGEKRSKSMVVEISPRMLEDHPDWPKLATFAWRHGFHTRIRGWRTFDQEHPEQLKNRTTASGQTTHASRKTLWEIHPIHDIEVETEDGEWIPIEDMDTTGG